MQLKFALIKSLAYFHDDDYTFDQSSDEDLHQSSNKPSKIQIYLQIISMSEKDPLYSVCTAGL